MVERARRHVWCRRCILDIEPIHPAAGISRRKEVSMEQSGHFGGLRRGSRTTSGRLCHVGFERLGHWPGPMRKQSMLTVDLHLVHHQPRLVIAMTGGMGVKSIDIGLHGSAGLVLEPSQQPYPFRMMPRLDDSALLAGRWLKSLVEVFAKNSGGPEEARREKPKNFAGARQVAVFACGGP